MSLVLAATDPATAACPSKPAATFTVSRIIDAATLELNDGSVVRLAGILPPSPPNGGTVGEANAWPPVTAAIAELERLVLGKTVALAERAPRKDRYGRLRTDTLLIDGPGARSLTEVLARAGHARIYPLERDKICLEALLAAERASRKAQAGLWQLEAFRVRSASKPREIAALAGQMVLVEGRVLDAAETRGRVYLNFGPRWREDFTIIVPKKLASRFRKLEIDLGALSGKRIRVRGFVGLANGPSIMLTLVEHLEFIDPAPKLQVPEVSNETGVGLIEISTPPAADNDDPIAAEGDQ